MQVCSAQATSATMHGLRAASASCQSLRAASKSSARQARVRHMCKASVKAVSADTRTKDYDTLCEKLREISTLNGISGLLGWDEQVRTVACLGRNCVNYLLSPFFL